MTDDLRGKLTALHDELDKLRDKPMHSDDEPTAPDTASGSTASGMAVLNADDATVLRDHGVALRPREGRQHRTEQYVMVRLTDATGDRLDRQHELLRRDGDSSGAETSVFFFEKRQYFTTEFI